MTNSLTAGSSAALIVSAFSLDPTSFDMVIVVTGDVNNWDDYIRTENYTIARCIADIV